jgi:hypothetical protein
MRQEETDYVVARLPKRLFRELVAAKQGVEEFSPRLDHIRCDDGTVRRIKRVIYGKPVESTELLATESAAASGCYVVFTYENGTLKATCVGTCPQATYECRKVATPSGFTCRCVRIE